MATTTLELAQTLSAILPHVNGNAGQNPIMIISNDGHVSIMAPLRDINYVKEEMYIHTGAMQNAQYRVITKEDYLDLPANLKTDYEFLSPEGSVYLYAGPEVVEEPEVSFADEVAACRAANNGDLEVEYVDITDPEARPKTNEGKYAYMIGLIMACIEVGALPKDCPLFTGIKYYLKDNPSANASETALLKDIADYQNEPIYPAGLATMTVAATD